MTDLTQVYDEVIRKPATEQMEAENTDYHLFKQAEEACNAAIHGRYARTLNDLGLTAEVLE